MTDLPALFRVLADRFGEEVEAERRPTLEDVRRFVSGRIAVLLDRNPGFLMSILYRIDVPEEQVRAAFRHERTEAIPDRLAELIVTRQLEKLETRRLYRNHEAR